VHPDLGPYLTGAFVVRTDIAGVALWSKVIAGTDDVEADHVLSDHEGNIVIVVESDDQLTIDGLSVPAGFSLVKLTPAGDAIWAIGLPSEVTDVAVNANGEIALLTAVSKGQFADCAPGKAIVVLTPEGNLKGFLADGAMLSAIAAHPDGGWVVVGSAQGALFVAQASF
jgi:hypothetical protein